ncbi:MAG: hypothetical protein EOM24_31365 [Chloroflexia bacterium]|nr:hypothetical protein [Chloroflexia bacterium]
MPLTDTSSELEQMNRYWFLLSATLNELGVALHQGDHTPEERLATIRALYDTMQSGMPPAAPLSVVAAAQVREAERTSDKADEPEQYYRRTADGTFEGPFTFTAEDGAPFTPEEDAIMQADWERGNARHNNMA